MAKHGICQSNFNGHTSAGGGPKVPYPKHVWSPAGGWYTQPANWKANTAVFGLVIIGVTGIFWKLSANREYRHQMPEEGRFFPSRYWSKQIIEYEAAQKAAKEGKRSDA
ncbi:hypothetical protein F5Y18DRAFT_426705 [Xylariaceae sp. FL1019]|nr:hypothetical protein F5Y18DRAFT_426705 [Xylariaceae sp. FL1019]